MSNTSHRVTTRNCSSVKNRHFLSAVPYRFSWALSIMAFVTAAIGALYPDIFHEVSGTAGNAQGTDIVIAGGAIPTLIISMMLTKQGSLRAQMVWLGALAYITYNALFFSYGIHFNQLFLLYAVVLSLAICSIVTFLREIDVERLSAHFMPTTPRRALSIYLLTIATIFSLLWLKDIIPAIVENTKPTSLTGTGLQTNPIEMSDIAFGLPLTFLSAVWLWKRNSWGYFLSGTMFIYTTLEAASITLDQLCGHLRDSSQSLTAVPIFGVLLIISFIVTNVYFYHCCDGSTRKGYPLLLAKMRYK